MPLLEPILQNIKCTERGKEKEKKEEEEVVKNEIASRRNFRRVIRLAIPFYTKNQDQYQFNSLRSLANVIVK